MEKLENIPVRLNPEEIKKKLHLDRIEGLELEASLLETARLAIKPRAVYKVCYVEERLKGAVIIDGICFTSRVLRKNLEEVERVFAYVVTIGRELEEMAGSCKDIMEKYFFDSIGNVVLVQARKYLEDQLRSRFSLGGVSFMSPGSLGDWPIEEQGPLFSLLEGVEDISGVRLNKSFRMIPKKRCPVSISPQTSRSTAVNSAPANAVREERPLLMKNGSKSTALMMRPPSRVIPT